MSGTFAWSPALARVSTDVARKRRPATFSYSPFPLRGSRLSLRRRHPQQLQQQQRPLCLSFGAKAAAAPRGDAVSTCRATSTSAPDSSWGEEEGQQHNENQNQNEDVVGDEDIVSKPDPPPSSSAPFVLANAAPLAAAAAAAAAAGASESFVPTPELLRFCEPYSDPAAASSAAAADNDDTGAASFVASSSGSGKKLKVAVLLSGGVDSSVALTLLRAAGHECTAFYLQIWFQEDFRNFWDQCPWEDDLKVAQGVCDVLDVPLEVVPLTNQYWDLVVSHSIDEISKGRTPNPDMLCNSRVKFGAFREYLLATYPEGSFDRVASGHYAALDRSENNADPGKGVKLVMSGDAHKDQTYFLAHLSQAQLSGLSFPIGGLPKSHIRDIAAAAGLPNAGRKDSQGICFLGKVKFSEFVAEHLGERPGAIVELESGERLGTHRGFWFHTIGQRSGLGLSGGPWYVCAKDTDANVVYVTRDYYSVDKERNIFRVGSFNWISGAPPRVTSGGWVLGFGADRSGPYGVGRGGGGAGRSRSRSSGGGEDAVESSSSSSSSSWLKGGEGEAKTGGGAGGGVIEESQQQHQQEERRRRGTGRASEAEVAAAAASELYCKVRHGEKRYRCTLRYDDETASAGTVVIDSHDQGLAAGQFAVFYDGEECLGCGVILEQPKPPGLDERDAKHRAGGDTAAGTSAAAAVAA